MSMHASDFLTIIDYPTYGYETKAKKIAKFKRELHVSAITTTKLSTHRIFALFLSKLINNAAAVVIVVVVVDGWKKGRRVVFMGKHLINYSMRRERTFAIKR
jgi:hypothetical protein